MQYCVVFVITVFMAGSSPRRMGACPRHAQRACVPESDLATWFWMPVILSLG